MRTLDEKFPVISQAGMIYTVFGLLTNYPISEKWNNNLDLPFGRKIIRKYKRGIEMSKNVHMAKK